MSKLKKIILSAIVFLVFGILQVAISEMLSGHSIILNFIFFMVLFYVLGAIWKKKE